LWKKTNLPKIVTDAISHIYSVLDNPGLTPTSVANHLGVGLGKLKTAFRIAKMSGVGHVIRKLRMEEECYVTANHHLPVIPSESAMDCGAISVGDLQKNARKDRRIDSIYHRA
jgi:hypothetical protein